MAREYDLTFLENETWLLLATLRDGDGKPLTLTGATVQWLVYTIAGATLLSASTANGMITVVDAATATVKVAVSPASHAAIDVGEYLHVLRVILATGVITDQIVGRLLILNAPVV